MAQFFARNSSAGPSEEARRRREVEVLSLANCLSTPISTPAYKKQSFMSLNQWETFLLSQVRRYFDRADKNKDGKLTKERLPNFNRR